MQIKHQPNCAQRQKSLFLFLLQLLFRGFEALCLIQRFQSYECHLVGICDRQTAFIKNDIRTLQFELHLNNSIKTITLRVVDSNAEQSLYHTFCLT